MIFGMDCEVVCACDVGRTLKSPVLSEVKQLTKQLKY